MSSSSIHFLNRPLGLWAILFFLAIPLLRSAEEVIELSPEEVDRILDSIFIRQREIRRIQATILTEKSGGVFQKSRSLGMIKADGGGRFWFLDRGDPEENLSEEETSLILLDGVYLWELFPKDDPDAPREAERRPWKQAAAEGKNFDLTALFVGHTVRTVQELRDEFEIEGALCPEESSYRFVLRRKSSSSEKEGLPSSDSVAEGNEGKKNKESIKEKIVTVWIRPEEAIPWKARSESVTTVWTVGAEGKQKKTKREMTEWTLWDVQTNLSGLPPFPIDTFLFPYVEGMKVINEKGDSIPPDILQNDLAALRARWETEARSSSEKEMVDPQN